MYLLVKTLNSMLYVIFSVSDQNAIRKISFIYGNILLLMKNTIKFFTNIYGHITSS